MDLSIGRLSSASPPPELRREVRAAAERAEQLRREQRELHFELEEDSGRVVVQVRDLDGGVIRTIAPSEALDIVSGKPI
jgi:uncharacterized FlaG/YvyC family protein